MADVLEWLISSLTPRSARIEAEARLLFTRKYPLLMWHEISACERQCWREEAENELYGEK